MPGKGIDHATCPNARVVRSLFSEAERAFADVLKNALYRKAVILLKVRVLDVIELHDEPDRRRLFFWRDVLGDQHFDYVVCSRQTLEPLLGVELDDPRAPRRSATGDAVKATVARKANFPPVRFSAGATLTPEAVRERLVTEWWASRAGPLLSKVE